MDTITADSTLLDARPRTVGLTAALALGAAAVAGAFGSGYLVAQALDPADPAAVARTSGASHTFGDALTQSLALKQRAGMRGEAVDVRDRRVE